MSEPTEVARGRPLPTLSGRFGRYEIERLIGRGGMGAAYLARQVDLDRPVVIKVMGHERDDGAVALERFRREAQAAARIDSDNVVKVYEQGVEGGLPFISMEYVDGLSAAELLEKKAAVEPTFAATIVAGALRGLRAAHDAGVVHRDVKPSNILIARDGRVKVVDFGVARFLKGTSHTAIPDAITARGETVGTPAYMAPEQAMGSDVDGKADVYALGATYYELLTGMRPFRGEDTRETLKLRLAKAPIPPRQIRDTIPVEHEKACLALMARGAAQRPDAAEALALLLPLTGEAAARDLPASRAASDAADPEARTVAHVAVGDEAASPFSLTKMLDVATAPSGIPVEAPGVPAVTLGAHHSPPPPEPERSPGKEGERVSLATLAATVLVVVLVLAFAYSSRPGKTDRPAEQAGPEAVKAVRERLVEAIASRQSVKVVSARDEIARGGAFPERQALLDGADLAARLLRAVEDRASALPARSRIDLPTARLEAVFEALAESRKVAAGSDADLRAAATLLAAAERSPVVPKDLLAPSAETEPGALIGRLGLEYPRASEDVQPPR